MDEDQTPESCVTINFDNGAAVRLKKSFLMNHSDYFQVMFGGNFVESKSGHIIELKDITYQGFMGVVNCLKDNCIQVKGIEELLLILETSQILQFTDTIEKSIELIEERYLLTVSATYIFPVVWRLGLKQLYEKARIYILYNFKILLIQDRESFFRLNKQELIFLLQDHRLNIEKEIDVYNLIIDWCDKTKSYDIMFEMTMCCVHFNCMSIHHLECIISKSKNLDLKNHIKLFHKYTNQELKSMGYFIQPARSVPNLLCALSNEGNFAYIYCWDWSTLKFERFIKINPLPNNINGYHVFVKGMNIFVMFGEIFSGRGTWNKIGWRYNLLCKTWKTINDCYQSKRRHGVGHFCGNELYILGGITKDRIHNESIERYKLKNDDLVRVERCEYPSFANKIDRSMCVCLEHKNHLILITQSKGGIWHEFLKSEFKPSKWISHQMKLKADVISAFSYLDNVYILGYKEKSAIVLICYCPIDKSWKELHTFKSVYDHDCTTCAFSINEAMVFYKNILECYNLDSNTLHEYSTQVGSFHSNYLFNLPNY